MGAVVPKKIPPKGSGEVIATLYPHGYKGKMSKTIYVHSNDPITPTVNLILIARVAEPCPWFTPTSSSPY